jgi:hypothetical protein
MFAEPQKFCVGVGAGVRVICLNFCTHVAPARGVSNSSAQDEAWTLFDMRSGAMAPTALPNSGTASPKGVSSSIVWTFTAPHAGMPKTAPCQLTDAQTAALLGLAEDDLLAPRDDAQRRHYTRRVGVVVGVLHELEHKVHVARVELGRKPVDRAHQPILKVAQRAADLDRLGGAVEADAVLGGDARADLAARSAVRCGAMGVYVGRRLRRLWQHRRQKLHCQVKWFAVFNLVTSYTIRSC